MFDLVEEPMVAPISPPSLSQPGSTTVILASTGKRRRANSCSSDVQPYHAYSCVMYDRAACSDRDIQLYYTGTSTW